MDFALPDEIISMQQAVREFARNEIGAVAADLDKAPRFPWETLRKMGDLGLLGMLTPPSTAAPASTRWRTRCCSRR